MLYADPITYTITGTADGNYTSGGPYGTLGSFTDLPLTIRLTSDTSQIATMDQLPVIQFGDPNVAGFNADTYMSVGDAAGELTNGYGLIAGLGWDNKLRMFAYGQENSAVLDLFSQQFVGYGLNGSLGPLTPDLTLTDAQQGEPGGTGYRLASAAQLLSDGQNIELTSVSGVQFTATLGDPSSDPATVTPEPTSLGLLCAAAGIGLPLWRRRRS